MKVYQLIEQLLKCDQQIDVYIATHLYHLEDIIGIENGSGYVALDIACTHR